MKREQTSATERRVYGDLEPGRESGEDDRAVTKTGKQKVKSKQSRTSVETRLASEYSKKGNKNKSAGDPGGPMAYTHETNGDGTDAMFPASEDDQPPSHLSVSVRPRLIRRDLHRVSFPETLAFSYSAGPFVVLWERAQLLFPFTASSRQM